VGHLPDGAECRIEVRAFADSIGVPEDPVTGSLNAGVGQWLIADGRLPPSYIASQGVRLGRSGRVHLDATDGEVWVGGGTRTLIVGELHL
jgi:predicted PhzF superfamily epimerase YddE/YHI9